MTEDLYPPDFGNRAKGPDTGEARALARELVIRRLLIGIGVLLLLVCIGTTTVSVVFIREQQVDRAPVTDSIQDNTRRIEDCTTPGRECYDRGQSQLRAAIRELNAYGVVVAACASGPIERTQDYIVRCVTERLPGLKVPSGIED